jgi:hypothetical protein
LVYGVTEEPPEPIYLLEDIFCQQIEPPRIVCKNVVMLTGYCFVQTVETELLPMLQTTLYEINQAIEDKD